MEAWPRESLDLQGERLLAFDPPSGSTEQAIDRDPRRNIAGNNEFIGKSIREWRLDDPEVVGLSEDQECIDVDAERDRLREPVFSGDFHRVEHPVPGSGCRIDGRYGDLERGRACGRRSGDGRYGGG